MGFTHYLYLLSRGLGVGGIQNEVSTYWEHLMLKIIVDVPNVLLVFLLYLIRTNTRALENYNIGKQITNDRKLYVI